MLVGIQMIHTIFKAPLALGTVAEFHIGIICISNPTYRTFMQITFSLLYLSLCFFEIDGLVVGVV